MICNLSHSWHSANFAISLSHLLKCVINQLSSFVWKGCLNFLKKCVGAATFTHNTAQMREVVLLEIKKIMPAVVVAASASSFAHSASHGLMSLYFWLSGAVVENPSYVGSSTCIERILINTILNSHQSAPLCDSLSESNQHVC